MSKEDKEESKTIIDKIFCMRNVNLFTVFSSGKLWDNYSFWTFSLINTFYYYFILSHTSNYDSIWYELIHLVIIITLFNVFALAIMYLIINYFFGNTIKNEENQIILSIIAYPLLMKIVWAMVEITASSTDYYYY